MHKLLVVALALAAGGCAIADSIREAQEREDSAKCLSYGAKLGDPAYVQCRAQLDAARTDRPGSGAVPPPNVVQNEIPPPQPWHR